MEYVEKLVEKYRPNKLDDLLIDPNVKAMLRDYLNKKTVPNLLLHGTQGIGKTSLAKLLVGELNCDYLYLNASIENGIDIIRDRVQSFCNTSSMDGQVKMVILDESDGLSGSAQSALRNIIDTASGVSFIFTCNFLDKIIAPIQSRCTPIRLEFTLKDVIGRIVYILNEEKIKYSKDELKKFVNEILVRKFPDIRLILNILEQCIVSGTLKVDYKETTEIFDTILNKINSSAFNLKEFRQFILDNQNTFGKDYILLSSYIFSKTDDPAKLITIADHIYRMNIVLDKEIEFVAMVLSINTNKK